MLANESLRKHKTSSVYSKNLEAKSELSSLLDEIDELADLEKGWNGETAKTISKDSITFSKNFCKQFLESNSGLPLPTLDPHPDGSVAFTWRSKNGIINVACLAEKIITYAAYIPNKDEYKNRGKLNKDTLQDIAKWVLKIVKA